MENTFIYNGQTFTEGSKVRLKLGAKSKEQDAEITSIEDYDRKYIRFFVLFNVGDAGGEPPSRNKKGWKKSWCCAITKEGIPYSGDFPKLLKLAILENIIEADTLFIN